MIALFDLKQQNFVICLWKRHFIFYTLIYQMGNTQAQNNTSCIMTPSLVACQGTQKTANVPRNKTFIHISMPGGSGQLTLAHFHGQLLIAQCFYVLSTLLQLYYISFTRKGRAIVCSELCTINQLGELKIENEDKAFNLEGISSATSFVSVLSQILELVEELAWEKQWANNGQCGYFRQKIIKNIYKYHSDEDRLYQQLMGEVFSFMKYNQYRTNLLPAILRRNIPQQALLQRKMTHKRYESASFETSARRQHQSILQMSEIPKRLSNLSFIGPNKDKKRSFYHKKMAHTEGQEYYENLQQIHRDEKQSSFQNSTTVGLTNNRNYISSQFSMNIAGFQPDSSPQNKAKVRFQKNSNKVYYNNDEKNRNLNRNSTTNQFQHKYTKSVLQDLARSVIVREVPSSNQIIF